MKNIPKLKPKEKKFGGRTHTSPRDPLTNLTKLTKEDYDECEVCQLLLEFRDKVQPELYITPLLPKPQRISQTGVFF